MNRIRIYFIFVLVIVVLSACNSNKKNELSKEEKIAMGESLFQSATCYQCHSLSGENLYGPALDSVLNTSIIVTRNKDKIKIKVDSVYIRRSITDPEYEKAEGFDSRKMPVPTLSDEQVDAIVQYLIFINEKK